jgi:putative ABC transport system permease protein
VLSDLKHAFRLLRRAPAFACTAVLLLALGVGVTTAMFGIVDAWLLQPLPFPDSSRLAIGLKAEAQRPTEPKLFIGFRDWEAWAGGNRSFTSLAAVFWRSFEADDPSEPGIFGMVATANLFDTLGVAPQRGRTFRPADIGGPPVAVISHQLWQQRFGGAPDTVGKTVRSNGKAYQIVGVMPPGFGLRMIDQPADAQFYALLQAGEEAWRSGGQGPVAAIGRLQPGVSLAAAETQLQAIQRGLDERYGDNPKGYTVLLTGLQQDNTRSLQASLWMAAAAAGLVLLIVCANIGGLLLGRGMERAPEMAVRAALGSGRARIIRQLLTESAAIAVLGAALGAMLAAGAIRVFAAVNPFGRMPQNPISLQGRAFVFAVLTSVAGTLLFGLAPALHSSNPNLNGMMKAAGRGVAGGLRAFRWQAILVAGQVALAMLLLVGAALTIQTLDRLQSHPLGFRAEDLTLAEVTIPRDGWQDAPRKQVLYQRLWERLHAIPGVQSAALSNILPLAAPFEDRFWIAGQPEGSPETAPKAGLQTVSADYFATMGIPLLQGRGFTEHDAGTAERAAVVNQSAARQWFGGQSPIGRRIKYRDDAQWQTVVGVVGDTSYSFYNKVDWFTAPRIFYPLPQAANGRTSPVSRQIYALLRGRAVTQAQVRDALNAIDPALRPGRVLPVRELISDAVRQPRLRTRMLALGSAIALLLAAIGIYAVMAQSVSRRRHEIGIRMALGARHGDVVRMVVKQGAGFALLGIAAGTLGGLLFTRTLASLLYGVKPADVTAFASAAAVLFTAVLLAALVPARKAARVDPAEALRED